MVAWFPNMVNHGFSVSDRGDRYGKSLNAYRHKGDCTSVYFTVTSHDEEGYLKYLRMAVKFVGLLSEG